MRSFNDKELAAKAGKKGGKARIPTKGFGADKERARMAGIKGAEAARKKREHTQSDDSDVHTQIRNSSNQEL